MRKRQGDIKGGCLKKYPQIITKTMLKNLNYKNKLDIVLKSLHIFIIGTIKKKKKKLGG